MSGRRPEERVRVPLLHQRWRQTLFLHWRYPVEAVAPLLPDELKPDVFDGSAWVSLTPFLVEGARPPLVPPLPGVSRFPETNLRTYAAGPAGVDGLWFLTLEAESVPSVVASRVAEALPYRLADMEVEEERGEVRYTSRRRSDPDIGHCIRVHPGAAITEPTAIDHWLTGRWRAWVRIAGRLGTVPVQHQEWPLHQVEVVDCEESLLAAHGLPRPAEPPLAHWSRASTRGSAGRGCREGGRAPWRRRSRQT